ncbi:hypothetical protein HY086_02220 [Candidatus Gottesmanbacteria bacterium]|nr:hypothetical protein [Candidatus Gottesmanbacteria bacterium]
MKHLAKKTYFIKTKNIMTVLLRDYRQVVLTLIVLLIAADVIFPKESSDIRIFGILGIYIAGILIYKLNSNYTFFMGLLSLFLMYILFLITGTSSSTEKAAVWLFFFFGIGMIQRLKE